MHPPSLSVCLSRSICFNLIWLVWCVFSLVFLFVSRSAQRRKFLSKHTLKLLLGMCIHCPTRLCLSPIKGTDTLKPFETMANHIRGCGKNWLHFVQSNLQLHTCVLTKCQYNEDIIKSLVTLFFAIAGCEDRDINNKQTFPDFGDTSS